MINKDTFITMIKLVEHFDNEVQRWYNFGIDLYEKKITEIPYKLFDIYLLNNFNTYGIEWINWYLYERYSIITNEFLPYYDENNNEKYVHTPEELWDLVKDYRLSDKLNSNDK
jgi:hypothetical protein